jgi:signal transduction histidine kinase
MMGLCLLVLQLSLSPTILSRTISSLLSQIGCFLQCAFLIIGAVELKKGKLVSLQNRLWICSFGIAIAVLSVLLYNNSTASEAPNYRYLLRFGFRCLILSASFLASAIIIYNNSVIHKGLGQRLLVSSFLLFCITQLSYFAIVFFNVFGVKIEIPSFFGFIDLVTISMIGFSMVMWLLEDERARLSKANKELDSFLYTTSHDLRAPLASILGLTNLAKYEVKDQKATEYITKIENRTKKLDKVISDILLLAKTIKSEIELSLVDFNLLVKNTISDGKYRQGTERIAILYESNPNNTLLSDPAQLKIVLDNLIANALKYHNTKRQNPFVKITFSKKTKEVIITVEDNGEGIAKEAQDKIFNMFYRASLKAEGTGLGLYLVKEALTKLNGTIELVSDEKTGSVFTIRLAQKDFRSQHLR